MVSMPRSPRGAALLLGLLLCVAVRRGSAAEDSGDLTSYQASIDSLVELARTAQASAALKQQENAALLKENNILRDALVEASSQAGSCQSTSRPPEPTARGQRTPWHELSDAPFGMVQALWQTIVYRTNIKAWPNTSAAHVDSMHSRLEEGILEAWEKMMKIRSDRGEGIDSANLSNMFYSYQKTPGTLGHGLRNLTYMDELRDLWKIGLATFAAESKIPWAILHRFVDWDSASALESWATVSQHGTMHPAHVHGGTSSISGVYYIRTPPGAGPIQFQDPRGYPRTPFDNNAWEIQPEEGDMIIFPSWLSHEVLPTLGAAPRISIAFNMNFKPNLETDPGCLMPWVVTTGVSEQRNVSELQPPTPFSPNQGDESGPE